MFFMFKGNGSVNKVSYGVGMLQENIPIDVVSIGKI